jgi:L-aspartate oxidase
MNSSEKHSLSERQSRLSSASPSLSAVQSLLWEEVGILRNKEGLTQAADTLAAWQNLFSPPADRPSYELQNLVLAGRLVTEAALMRKESRGAHFRSDYPKRSSRWKHHIVFRKD